MFDKAEFYTNSPDYLIKAQKLLDSYIEDFGVKSDHEAEMLKVYREKRAEVVRASREMSIQITLITDIAKGESALEKANYMKAVSERKKVQYKIESIKERIYTIRHLNRGIEGKA